MKPWLSSVAMLLVTVIMVTAGACKSGGNVDDNDGAVSKTSVIESSGGGAVSEWMEDVRSDLGLDGSDSAISDSTVSQ